MTIDFEYCNFYSNVAHVLIQLHYYDAEDLCTHPTNTTFKNCNFTDNNSGILTLINHVFTGCQPNIIFNEIINIIGNTQETIIDITKSS